MANEIAWMCISHLCSWSVALNEFYQMVSDIAITDFDAQYMLITQMVSYIVITGFDAQYMLITQMVSYIVITGFDAP